MENLAVVAYLFLICTFLATERLIKWSRYSHRKQYLHHHLSVSTSRYPNLNIRI